MGSLDGSTVVAISLLSVFAAIGAFAIFERSKFMRRRGHGIHSPFVYDLVKKVYNSNSEYDRFIFDDMLNRGVKPTAALELAKLTHHCDQQGDYTYIILGEEKSDAKRAEVVKKGEERGATIVLLGAIELLQLVDNHPSTSIETGRYTIFFNNGLPKQNFKL